MTKNRSLLYIAILTASVALIWAGVSAYATIRKPTVSPDLQTALIPLNPQIDRSIFAKLSQRSQEERNSKP